MLVYHAAADWSDVAAAFARAGAEADIVVLFQSFWGCFDRPITSTPQDQMLHAIASAKKALFISSYGEVGNNATKDSLQGHAAKPSGADIPNFVTAIPLSFRSPGALLTPLNRPDRDGEPINFIAPSYYASGAGGTCPAAEVTAVVAAIVVAGSRDKPTPSEVLSLMRRTVHLDGDRLAAIPGYDATAATNVVQQARRLEAMQVDGERRLDGVGVLDLRGISRALAAQAE